MELTTEGTTLMNKPCRKLYHTLSGVLLETNDREFLQAYKVWNQNRKQQSGKDSRARDWLKRFK